ncbi:MAG: DUF4236 domain-containing protein [Clostridiales bacterium]|nr:DUF4236 domain-containing protein [Clostridiales bacterium]
MGMRFRKSIKIAPGVRVNVGKKSAGISVGGKYGGVSVNSKTGARARVSAPGTGLSYSSKIGSSTHSSSHMRCDSAYSESQTSTTDIPTSDHLRDQVKQLQNSLKIVTIAYPVLAVAFLLLGFIVPICFLPAAIFIYLRIRLVKKYKAEIPQLLEQAEQLDLVYDDLIVIEQAEQNLDKTKSAAIFFLNYDKIVEHSIDVLHKAPALSAYQSADDCQQAICNLFDQKLSEILKSDFERTYKHLFELKTQKGIDTSIEKFQAPYTQNLEKMTVDRQAEYASYVETLHGIQLAGN